MVKGDGSTQSAVSSGRVTPDEKFLSDLSKVWDATRETIESFGNTYLSAAAEDKPLSGPAWMEKNVELAARLWLLGLRSMGLVVQRTIDQARELGPQGSGNAPE